MAAFWQRVQHQLRAVLVALGLCLALGLTACSGASTGLSGNYVDDTMAVAQNLLTTIAIPQDDPGHAAAESESRALINSYMARYRPQSRVNGLSSFTTMQTALNSLAGHYTNYANRPLPDALRERIEKELQKAERNVVRGA
ncbi:photosystem II protein Psb27 [Synechococcus sp. CS-1328]|uniref:photosystem II protein Psb27 n=1 Tax=Synechococcus sp. CS-1328 TaxID=2847976 RepID=UPI00223AD688|nr:photosystem II protein Psb27 [Synechococcus sp. CS-1328]MCT0225135.1 photosystem II protein Psb27 [Synechococcus sp. CS-1328]